MDKITYPSSLTLNSKGPIGCSGVVDGELQLCGNGVDNHILLLKKKVCLRQVNPPAQL